MPLEDDLPERPTAANKADSLRDQAAACRRLSLQSRTKTGAKALRDLGEHFDEQARQTDPSSQKR
jgi:hypothetical protein